MIYGMFEENDLTDNHRKILTEGRKWGQKWLAGFLQSLNQESERGGGNKRFQLLQTASEDGNLADFVFAVGNRLCAVLFDVHFMKGFGYDELHFLTYERRNRLIQASFEHKFFPIVVNVRWEFNSNDGTSTFKTTDNWMTDIVSGEEVLPEAGMTDELRPVLEWEAHVRAVRAAADELKGRGYKIHWMAYDLKRKPDLWAVDREGNPVWVLVSYNRLGAEGEPDYSYFNHEDADFVDKRGIGIDVGICNLEAGVIKPKVFRGADIKTEIVAFKELYSPKGVSNGK